MGSSAQLYNLGWSDFDDSLKGAIKGLRSRGDLVDVTLAAGGKTFPAHKLVLSAASNLFLELLKVTPCQHPVILLAGIGACELEQVLDFVYTGEVSVQPSELSALLQAAHILNIHGLVRGSILAEKPEDQAAAEAALVASSEMGEKMDMACLAAATKTGILESLSSKSESLQGKRKAKWKHSACDTPHNKWRKCDSGDDSSDTENSDNELSTNTIATQTSPKSESFNTRGKQQVTKASCSAEGITTTSLATPVEDKITGDNSISLLTDQPGTSLPIIDDSIVPPHHLDMNEDDDKEESESLYSLLLKASQGGSNQPGVCPLCGTAVRQARNLRRHLLTSCKLRSSHLYQIGGFRTVMGVERQSGPDIALGQLSPSGAGASVLSDYGVSKTLEEDERTVLKEEYVENVPTVPEEVVCRPYIMSPELGAINTSSSSWKE